MEQPTLCLDSNDGFTALACRDAEGNWKVINPRILPDRLNRLFSDMGTDERLTVSVRSIDATVDYFGESFVEQEVTELTLKVTNLSDQLAEKTEAEAYWKDKWTRHLESLPKP